MYKMNEYIPLKCTKMERIEMLIQVSGRREWDLLHPTLSFTRWLTGEDEERRYRWWKGYFFPPLSEVQPM